MAVIYQWKIEVFMGNMKFISRAVEVKETKKQYKALNRNFLNYTSTISKETIGVVVSDGTSPIYSSLEPDEGVAIAKLTEWYEKYVKDKVEFFEAKILEHQTTLEKVRALSNTK